MHLNFLHEAGITVVEVRLAAVELVQVVLLPLLPPGPGGAATVQGLLGNKTNIFFICVTKR